MPSPPTQLDTRDMGFVSTFDLPLSLCLYFCRYQRDGHFEPSSTRCYTCPPAGKVPSTTTTVSPFRKAPNDVVEWDGFPEEVASYTPSNNRTLEERHVQFAEGCRVSNEGTLCTALDSNVFRLLSWLAHDGEFGAAAAIEMVAQADRVFYLHSGALRMAIEIKTKWCCPHRT
jgi:hypothetical protein